MGDLITNLPLNPNVKPSEQDITVAKHIFGDPQTTLVSDLGKTSGGGKSSVLDTLIVLIIVALVLCPNTTKFINGSITTNPLKQLAIRAGAIGLAYFIVFELIRKK